VITLPPPAELAAQARRVPLIDDALRLAGWCAPGRQVTAKGVLKPPAARQTVEELRLWQRHGTDEATAPICAQGTHPPVTGPSSTRPGLLIGAALVGTSLAHQILMT
jgi:hypothetical protein